MTETATSPGIESLQARVNALAAEKSALQLSMELMNAISSVSGVGNVIQKLLQSVVETIGGTNASIYYTADDEIFCSDVYGHSARLESVDDDVVEEVFLTGRAIEREQRPGDTKLRAAELPGARTWAVPLAVGADIIGVVKVENLVSPALRDIHRDLPAFFNYAALILKNEILGESRLRKANEELSRANAALKEQIEVRMKVERQLVEAGDALNERVRERTEELSLANESLQRELLHRREVERALSESSELLERVFSTTQAHIAYLDPSFRFIRVNRAYAEADEKTPDFFPGRNHFDLYPNDENRAIFQRVVDTGQPYFAFARPFEYADHPERGTSWWDVSLLPVRDQAGAVAGLVLSLVNVSDRERAVAALHKSDRELRIRNEITNKFLTFPDQRVFSEVLNVLLEGFDSPHGIFGYFREDGALVLAAVTAGVWAECATPGDTIVMSPAAWAESEIWSAIGRGEAVLLNEDRRVPEGHVPIRRVIAAPVVFGGQTIGLLIIANKATDYTPDDVRFLKETGERIAPILSGRMLSERKENERQKAEEELRSSEELFRRFFDANLAANVITGADGRVIACNQSFLDLFGLGTLEEANSICVGYRCHGTDERDRFLEILRAHETLPVHERKYQRIDGREITVMESAAGIFDERGELVKVIDFMFDLTERRNLEAQLLQSQKLEAVGRLAGGVAHDFNNMLTAIKQFARMASLVPGTPAKVRDAMEQVLKASDRAANLTRQLLAFSRKQMLQPRIVNLNATLESIGRLLPPLLGEKVRLEIRPGPDLWNVMVDPAQIEQVVVNLAVNARDAMPDGGQLVIDTSNNVVDPLYPSSGGDTPHTGLYVVLSVTDNGCGMTPEIRERIFEPFFTTKEAGKGTGLGLATSYGTIKQSGGFINVYSEPGIGTTFRIYLPAVDAAVEVAAAAPQLERQRGHGCVLLAEDEDLVRDAVVMVLEEIGYKVLAASDVPEAEELFNADPNAIDVLLSDMVMPSGNGRDLYRRLSAARPDLRAVFMSGYAADLTLKEPEKNTWFVQKPFTLIELVSKLAEALESK